MQCGVLLAESSFLVSCVVTLRSVNGLGLHIVFTAVACPKNDMLYRFIGIIGDTNDVIEVFLQVAIKWDVLVRRLRGDLFNPVQSKAEELSIFFGSSKEVPTVVVLLQQIGVQA